MASSSPSCPPLPTKDQCFALSDSQCHKILLHRDPDNSRANKNWELVHQPELVRLYMTMISFPQVRDHMKTKLDYCYKTYANRYKDWHLPVDRCEREQVVRELFTLVSDSSNLQSATSMTSTSSRLPIRPLQPHPSPQPSPSPSQVSVSSSQPYAVPSDFLFPARPQHNDIRNLSQQDQMSDRMSISSVATWSTGSAQSTYTYFDETFSNPRFSISTSNSSVSSNSQMPPRSSISTSSSRRSFKPAKHDARAGCWNDDLRVIPCGKDHSNLRWNAAFPPCPICGFSQWHALMLQARSIDINTFGTAMMSLRELCKADFAGNYSLHFLMTAGVGMEYFEALFQWDGVTSQNVFGQNPLHVLNPQDLGDSLINFLEWFRGREHPPGLLLTQRDIKGRTPMHTLLQYPMDRDLYMKILKVFPYAHHQLRSFDTSGRTAVTMMSKAALKIKSKSSGDYQRIQAGITEVKLFQSQEDQSQGSSRTPYGFHDIARGARGTSYIMGFFECRICGQTNSHSNSYLDQMVCACKFGRDRNGPDDTGMTAAHALITQERCNNDPQQSPESPSQTAELIRILIPRNDPTLLEALHVLDREGNSLVYNVAIRGFDEILQYILELEQPPRRRAMVNFCVKGQKGGEKSVLAAVTARCEEVMAKIRVSQVTADHRVRHRLMEKSHRLNKVKTLLLKAGAEMTPSITTRWQIYWG
ncbi:hypothetical protein G7Y89_g11509 [Cudoniella acicularis]|uniref:Uncharacterized protein n=1 Tax=Cudoniella acicularis TaxID=354080 RepID=A0A8H4RDK1_9HELO|nr:hypothetical protein G7Y89_g11509 [Cudoniella acicularis]